MKSSGGEALLTDIIILVVIAYRKKHSRIFFTAITLFAFRKRCVLRVISNETAMSCKIPEMTKYKFLENDSVK